MTKTKKQEIGKWGEEQAALFLIEHGYVIADRNFQIRAGEIDIIAWHKKEHFGKTLCFVEVKTRSYGEGSAERATGKSKIKKMFTTAKVYCFKNNIDMDNTPIQFEQVSVYIRSNGASEIKHYEILVV
ncbi:MAG: YraN family protein [Candidatus Magasanikbacteria bacterium CG_4_10_14_0_2_um_filter_37_12]|uniref:UPF0102 protein COX81_00530 n=1 Tax=Candidatus Magasanikbacteria bacterium CG_4_10_14_0_2_um_filter_37_12 TaxID=1974637 RepID=A0A2M7V9R3_9BACT|nr:MAG: YraN family protein [Candidatus Magasanikbacteria bacterium CG_4_10_14_0_2_um_filter_37_12]